MEQRMRGNWGAWDWAVRTRRMGACCVEQWLLPSQAAPCVISFPVTPFNTCLHHWCGNFFTRVRVNRHFLPIFRLFYLFIPAWKAFCSDCNLLLPLSSPRGLSVLHGSACLCLLVLVNFSFYNLLPSLIPTCAWGFICLVFKPPLSSNIWSVWFSRSLILAGYVPSHDLYSILLKIVLVESRPPLSSGDLKVCLFFLI